MFAKLWPGLHEFQSQSPILFYGGITVLFWGGVWTAVIEYFKPIGKRRVKATGRKPKLPNGPAGVPLLGSLPALAKTGADPDKTWLQDLTKYGEIATVHLGSKTFIFLNSHRVVSEFIVKRGSLTNTRSAMPIASGIVSKNRRALLMPQEQWIEHRRIMQPLLNGSHLQQYGEWQEQESVQMMAEYLFKPDRWYQHHYRYANSVVHRIALGERLVKSSEDLAALQNVVTRFLGSIGRSMVDWFPDVTKLPKFLRWWEPEWERLGTWNYNVYKSWWDPVVKAINEGTAPPSWVRDTLLHKDTKFTGDEMAAMYLAMQPIEAGSDTTREALAVMVMAALEYPEVFRKARQEVDRVCGTGANARLPVLADMEELRYICAMAKEVLRWRPLFHLTPDHTSTKDIEFEGYYFPAGVGFVINEIAVGNECDSPESFIPERWLDGHEMDITHGLWQFGGGRRICIGSRLAQRSLFLNIARLAQCIDYEANGPYDSKRLHHHSTKEPFPVKATVRGFEYENLIIAEATKFGVLEDAKVIRDEL